MYPTAYHEVIFSNKSISPCKRFKKSAIFKKRKENKIKIEKVLAEKYFLTSKLTINKTGVKKLYKL